MRPDRAAKPPFPLQLDSDEWQLIVTLLWIGLRDVAEVTRVADEWRGQVQKYPALATATAAIKNVSLFLSIRAQDQKSVHAHNPEAELLTALRAGSVTALGRLMGSGDRRAVPKIEWGDLEILAGPPSMPLEAIAAAPNICTDGRWWGPLRFSASSVREAFPEIPASVADGSAHPAPQNPPHPARLRRPGWLFLDEALDIIGRSLFADEWNVSDLDLQLMQEPKRPAKPVRRSIAASYEDQVEAARELKDYPNKIELYQDELINVRDTNKRIMPAQERADRARFVLAQYCLDRSLVSAWGEGRPQVIDQYEWAKPSMVAHLLSGTIPVFIQEAELGALLQPSGTPNPDGLNKKRVSVIDLNNPQILHAAIKSSAAAKPTAVAREIIKIVEGEEAAKDNARVSAVRALMAQNGLQKSDLEKVAKEIQ